jgi:hypothetical protein
MKALTLTQPWATLVAIGAKRIESRSWSTSYRGPLAIHAAKQLPVSWSQFSARPFTAALGDLAPLNNYGAPDLACLPCGVVLATCELIDVRRVEDRRGDWVWVEGDADVPGGVLPAAEVPFGDFNPGRFAWMLENVRPLDEPVPARGRLGLWEWEPVGAA